jgi:hypothetical protein
MTFVTGKAIPRRTVLRGIGAAMALPWLDAMAPAFAGVRSAAVKPALRFGAVYVPNGVIMSQFTPPAVGKLTEFTPILAPLTPFRDRVLVLSGLSNSEARPLVGEGGGAHDRASGAFLTGAHPKKTDGPDVRAGISVDQIAAQAFGAQTQLSSLELSVDPKEFVGGCDPGYACVYSRTISWRAATSPLPMENKPRAVFERLFGDVGNTDPAVRSARREMNRSLLDSVSDEVSRVQRDLGSGDRLRLAEYLDAVRDVERRIQKEEEQSDRELPHMEQPVGGVPPTFREHVKLLFDLQALAFQSDLTRVFTFMLGREGTRRSYPEIGIPDAHHPLTHTYDPEPVRKVIKINTYHMDLFAYFLEKLHSIEDGDGSLLDHSALVYGAGIDDGNAHTHEDIPIVVAGASGGAIKGGRHLRNTGSQPVANLWLTVLDKLGVPVDGFGDSNGHLQGLSGV